MGGSTLVPRAKCGPASCPQPPLSDSEERAPYCPSWVDLLTGNFAGRLLLAVNNCLFVLKAKCSGMLWYDRTTEQVSVQTPPFVSSIPREASYGFLAKVVTTVRQICVEGAEGCITESHQELAAQIMEAASCGALVIARPPLCGELPLDQSANADKQARLDYLEPPNHEDVGCPKDIRFLVGFPSTRGSGQSQVACTQWSSMRRIVMRASQWGFIAKGSSLEGGVKQIVAMPVSGGDDADPCYEMRVLESGSGGLPSEANNCDTLQYKFSGTPQAGWYAVAQKLGFVPLDVPVVVFSGAGTGTIPVTLPQFPTEPCGKVCAVFQTINYMGDGPSGAAATRKVTLGNYLLAYAGFHDAIGGGEARAVVASANVNLTIAHAGSSTGFTEVKLIGYEY